MQNSEMDPKQYKYHKSVVLGLVIIVFLIIVIIAYY